MATLYDVTQALVDLLRDNWADLEVESKEDIYYGDQAMLAHHPSITVDGLSKTRPLTGTGMLTTSELTIYIMLYHSALKNIQVKREEVDKYTNKVTTVIHSDKKLSGVVVHGHVTNEEVGVADRGGTMLRTVRLTYEAISRESIWP